MCLNCGIVLCGRYDNRHALNHSSKNADHDVCLNTLNGSVYCYKCDDFVINDTDKNALCDLRHELRDDDSLSETSTFESSSTKTQETASTSSSDSGWEEPNRKLRPRKRTTSSDSTEGVAKRKTLRKVRHTCNSLNKLSLGHLILTLYFYHFTGSWTSKSWQHLLHEFRIAIS